MSPWEVRLRLLVVRVAVLAAFLVLAVQLWQLQIVHRQEYQESADNLRFRVEAVDAPRGVFYDRNLQLLVTNVPKYVVSLVSARLPDSPEQVRAIQERLSSLLGIPVSASVSLPVASLPSDRALAAPAPTRDLERMFAAAEKRPFEAYPLAENIGRQLAFVVMEDLPSLPGVTVEIQPTRQYADGSLFAHILGYIGRIGPETLQKYLSKPNSDYTQNDLVGYAGLESTMEAELHGHRGRRFIEVDAYGRKVADLDYEAPQPGHSLILTLDRALQARTEQALRAGMTAAKSKAAVAIVMSPKTGELLSLVSLPSYDNNIFAQGRVDEYAQLTNDPTLPMFDRAIAGQYPPGSTFKIVPASAGLQEGVITTNTTFRCDGIMNLESFGAIWPFYCWISQYHWGHGNVNVIGALEQSCDIFFYQMTGGWEDFAGLGLDNLVRYAHMFGLGAPTGVELSGEANGLVPTARYKRLNYNESWTTGDTYNAAIGQGFVLVTPLQLINALSSVANGGTLYRPQVIREIVDADGNVVRPFEPKVIRTLDVSPEVLAIVREGLRRVVEGPVGTAPTAQLPGIAVAGKTGTAEIGERDAEGKRPSHAWFMAFAPVENPEVAVLVLLEGSESVVGLEGSGTAAPIGATLLRAYFGLPEPAATD
ncbi:MAG TPA: penicillin-binding protein 2 [Anaerolineae bacterium]|nr:penicillin-binding protein 2 [Anaerolineae bacterium]